MKLRTYAAAALVLAAAVLPVRGQQEGSVLSLSLEDCIARAMKNNLGVAVQVLNPAIASSALTQAGEKFYPTLTLGFNKRSTNSASYSFLDAEGSVFNKINDYSLDINQVLPFGGTLGLNVDSNMNDSNRSFQTINPRYGSTLTFDFTQPLLKDFGWNTSRQQILIARNNLAISESNLETTLMTTLYQVESAYWTLAYTIDDLQVRRQSLQLARDLLEKNRRSVEVGQLAPIEILSAQAEVATREADILQAEAAVKNAEDQLKTLLNLSKEEDKAAASLVPTDRPTTGEKKISLDDALATALASRPDLRSTRIGLKNQELNVNYTRNQLLPGLNLTASYWSPGVSGTQIIYLNNNPLTGVILGTIPGGSKNSLKDAFNFKYENWTLGLTLSIPVSNVVSRAAYTQARLDMKQAMLDLQNQEQQVFLDIKTAVRAVETNAKRVQAYKVARELAEQKLAGEEEKLRVGLSTNYTVLQFQRDLSTARSAELGAIVDYNISLAVLDQALGTSLKNRNISLTDFGAGI